MIFSHIIRQIFTESLIGRMKSIFDKNLHAHLEEERRLRNLNRFQKSDTLLDNKLIEFFDVESFLHMRNEIFEKEIYRFSSDIENPKIIDCGANIGLSAIYFNRLYPKAEITAFEAEPAIFKTLKKNVSSFRPFKTTSDNL